MFKDELLDLYVLKGLQHRHATIVGYIRGKANFQKQKIVLSAVRDRTNFPEFELTYEVYMTYE